MAARQRLSCERRRDTCNPRLRLTVAGAVAASSRASATHRFPVSPGARHRSRYARRHLASTPILANACNNPACPTRIPTGVATGACSLSYARGVRASLPAWPCSQACRCSSRSFRSRSRRFSIARSCRQRTTALRRREAPWHAGSSGRSARPCRPFRFFGFPSCWWHCSPCAARPTFWVTSRCIGWRAGSCSTCGATCLHTCSASQAPFSIAMRRPS